MPYNGERDLFEETFFHYLLAYLDRRTDGEMLFLRQTIKDLSTPIELYESKWRRGLMEITAREAVRNAPSEYVAGTMMFVWSRNIIDNSLDCAIRYESLCGEQKSNKFSISDATLMREARKYE